MLIINSYYSKIRKGMHQDKLVYQYNNQKQENEESQSLSYEKVNNILSKITSRQKVYHYCACQKKRLILYEHVFLILFEDKIKGKFFIYCIPAANIKLSFSIIDYDVLTKIHGGIQLTIIKSTQTYKDRKFRIQFKGIDEPSWAIQIQNTEIRNLWLILLDEKIKQVQFKEKDSLIKKEIQKSNKQIYTEINQNQTYLQEKKINQLIACQFRNIRNVISGLLNQTCLDEIDKKTYLNDKLNLFHANFQILATQINQIESQFTKQILKYKETEQNLTRKLSELQARINVLIDQNNKIPNLIQKERVYCDSIRKLQLQNQNLQKEKKKLIEGNSGLQKLVLQQKSSGQDILKKSQSNETKYSTLQQQISILQQCLTNQKTSRKRQLEKYQQQLAQNEIKIQTLNHIIQIKQLKIQQQEKKTQIMKQQLEKTIIHFRSFQKELEKMKNVLRENELLHIFQGPVLQKLPFYRSFMREKIEEYTKRQILMTKIIYRFDHLNKVNFHAYIDNHSNVALIIKAINGSYLAGFSEDPFSSTASATQGGLILSLTNQKIFYLQAQKKAVTYDDYYLIFGNSQIRVKSLQQKVFSNFGISNGFYNTNGFKVDILLCDDANREIDIDGYEVHEIIFKD